MRRWGIAVVAVLLVAGTVWWRVGSHSATSSAKAPDETSAKIFGLASHGSDQGVPASFATAKALARHLDIASIYVSWGLAPGLPTARLDQIADGGAKAEITWEPWDPRKGKEQPRYALARITAGDYDSYIEQWAHGLKAFGRPVLLRFAHEMNATAYPWSVVANGNTLADYAPAYRHVHDIFSKVGASNVTWVWSPNVIDGLTAPLTALYPGTAYVDLVGVDGYNGGTDVPGLRGWRTPGEVFDRTFHVVHGLAPKVPVIITETGVGPDGGDKAQWITDLFSYLKAEHPEVIGVIWFDVDKTGPHEADWRLSATPRTVAAARTALASW